MNLPHDHVDLALAPTVLALDARIEELGGLDFYALRRRIALDTNGLEGTREMREHGLMLAVIRDLDLHGWDVSWHERGFALAHGPHRVVIGLPPTLRAYLELHEQVPQRA